MSQFFVHLMPTELQSGSLLERLRAAGFSVTAAGRLVGGFHVRVREGTEDESEVERIVSQVAPETTRGPNGTPAMTIDWYRSH